MTTTKIEHDTVYGEQLKLVVAAIPLSLLAVVINGGLLAAIQWSVIGGGTVVGWYLALLLISGLRYFWFWRYQREAPEQRNPIYWGNLFFFGTILSGVSWGAAAYLLFPVESLPHQLFLAFVLAGMCAGALTTLAPINLYFQSFVLLSLLPLTARFLQHGGPLDLAMGGMVVLFMVMVSASAQRVHRTIIWSLQLGLSQQHSDEALHDADEHNRLLLESAAEGIFGVDVNGVTTFVNPAAVKMLGYEEEELIGKPMHALIHHHHADGSDYPVVNCPMSLTLRTGVPHFVDDEVLWHKGGRPIPVEYNSTPIFKGGAVVGTVVSFSDISQRIEAESRLEYQAYFDALTGLANRRLLMDRLEQALTRAQRHNHMGGLLFLDLDNFKTINDSLGHKVGDELLCMVAERLLAAVRAEDTVARMGGDDFVILLPEVDDDPEHCVEALQEVADKCCEYVARPYPVQGHELHVTTSIGIALFPMGVETADDLLKQADTAMYRAKEQGQGISQFFLPSMQLAVEERMHLYNDLRYALKRDELELHYQTQCDTAGRIVGAEALLRWHHPTRGLVSPLEFIALAEDTGLVLSIGEWVLLSVCRLLRRLDDAGMVEPLAGIAVNVSPRQFRQPSFVQRVAAILEETGVDGGHLELELTEGILIEDVEDTIDKMEALKAMGIRFAIDDFGTGYSSLAYLQQMPIHKLKIDQSFVRNLGDGNNGAVLTDTIIVMGKHLNLTVIAEGVETQAQFLALCHMGCDQYQGYLFNRPVDEDCFLRLLRGEGEHLYCP
ncbi:MAG: EAL domain-containing protein [Gammaproteobacteria bacterium]|nr:EAL domain-containing protein [Gammaproteobacteria bacterium]